MKTVKCYYSSAEDWRIVLKDRCVSSPGRLLPLLEVSVSEGELVQLGEQVVGDVLLVSVLRPEDELNSLRRRICGENDKLSNSRSRRRHRVSLKSVDATICGRLSSILPV